MAVWSIVRVSELEGARRLDTEYYRPEYLALKQFLSKHPLLQDCIEAIIHPTEIKRVYEDRGIQILLAQNIQNNFLDFGVAVYMPESVRIQILRNELKPNDVVMTRSGANYGDAAPYFGEPSPLYACADDLIIRPKRDLPAGYLATFFNTAGGRSLIKRGGYGAGQPHIAPPFLSKLHIPRFYGDAERNVDSIVKRARDEMKHSGSLYLQAEKMVLAEVALDRLDLTQPKWWTVPLSQTQQVHRIDSDHFQPKYDSLIDHLKGTGKAKVLGGISPYIRRGLQPEYFADGNIVVVNSQHLGSQLLSIETTERTNRHFWDDNKRSRLQKNDVLVYSTGAYVGRTNVWLEDQEGIASNHVTIIRPNDDCNPLYLAVFLNAPVGLLQTEKWASGSGQREIYPSDVARFLVYLPAFESQQQVADLVQQSYQARQKAHSLLEEAKTRVETLITESATQP